MTKTIEAQGGQDLAALIAVRQALESGVEQVRVVFPAPRQPALFEPKDLPAIRQKITYSM